MSALAEALVAAQRRAVAVLEKVYVAGAFEDDRMRELLDKIGCTDGVDQSQLIECLDTIRAYGGPLPASTAASGDAPKPPDLATAAQVTFAQDLFRRANIVPLDEADLKRLPRERASALIEQLKAGTYNPDEWDVPF